MNIKITFTALLAFFSVSALADMSKQEWCDMVSEDRANYLKYPDLAPYAPPTSNVPSSFSDSTPSGKLTTDKTANMLSGYYCDSPNNHPLIYASSSGFTVTGVGFNKVFPLNEMNEAIKAYKKLLVSAGYTKRW